MNSAFSQKSFFLDALAGSTLFLVLPVTCAGDAAALPILSQVLKELIQAGVRGILVFQAQTHLPPLLQPLLDELAIPCHLHADQDHPGEVLLAFRHSRCAWLALGLDNDLFFPKLVELAQVLRPARTLLLDSQGGLHKPDGTLISYMNPSRLRHWVTDLTDQAPHRQAMLQAVIRLMAAGTGAVSLCRMADVAVELYTYEGRGTFFSPRHYCRVRRLGMDDFAGMEALVRRGEQEGFLLPRDERGLVSLLVAGYGAFMADNRLAGVCALLTDPYQEARAGELVGLYTLTRFQGEGVAGRLLRHVRQEARRRQLAYLFACTCIPRVVDFFHHHGFHTVALNRIAAAKWLGYDPQRQARLTCLRLDLEG